MMRGDKVIGVRFLEAGFECFITLDRHERFAPSIGILDGEQGCLVHGKRSMKEIEKVATFGPEKNRNDHQTAQTGEHAIPADAPNFLFKVSVSHEIASKYAPRGCVDDFYREYGSFCGSSMERKYQN